MATTATTTTTISDQTHQEIHPIVATAITDKTTATTITTAISNATVTGKLLTGYTSGAGTVLASDSILTAIQKLNGNTAALGSPITALTGDVTATGPGSVAATIKANYKIGTIGATFSGSGGVITTGYGAAITVPFNMTITNWQLVSTNSSGLLSGSIVIDVVRSGSSIVGGSGNKPTLSSASSANAAVSSWTSTTLTAGDIILFNVSSATTVQSVNLTITGNKT